MQQNSMMQLSAVDEVLPFSRLLFLGLQHVLDMYAGDIAVPLIVSEALQLPASETVTLIYSSLFVAGIVTLIQCLGVWKFGARLPVMMGATFLSVTPMISMGLESHIGLQGYYGALLVSGALGILIAPLMGQILQLFPPVVSGSLITLLGLSLMGVAINWVGGGQPTVDRVVNGVSVTSANPAYGGPQRLGLAILVIVVILLFRKFGRGIWQSLATLVGIIIGTIVAIPLGEFHAPNLTNRSWIAFTPPAVEAGARRLGCRRIRLTVGKANEAARLLYEQRGYRVVGESESRGLLSPAGEIIHEREPVWEMTKSL